MRTKTSTRSLLTAVLAAVLFTVLFTPAVRAQLDLAPLFTDNMVLQRGKPVPVWGHATPRQSVQVTFGEQTLETKADGRGRWMVKLAPLSVGDGTELVVKGNYTITCKNVLVGEVWICSGQSNMEWRVTQTSTTEQDIAGANFPEIRLFGVKRAVANSPKDSCSGTWKVCTPQSVPDFSAVGYMFGRRLHQDLKVPVGLIRAAWGGTRAEAWTSRGALHTSELLPIVKTWDERTAKFPDQLKNHKIALAKWEGEKAKAIEAGKRFPNAPRQPGNPKQSPHHYSTLYNGMIAPLVPYAIQGAIWYQGESNVGRAYQYRALFKAMITDWRQQFQQGDFPFLFVQLAAYRYGGNPEQLAELWEAQVKATELPNVGMASAVDSNSPRDIHPQNKLMVSDRLALAAKAIAYGQDIVHSGPIYKSHKVDGTRILLEFDHVGEGLVVKGETLGGFTICGEDRKFRPASAKVEGTTVVVSSPDVRNPVAVRFAWHQTATISLYNEAGLPASPFRTDDFPAVTRGKIKP